jgi:hypothetical protein
MYLHTAWWKMGGRGGFYSIVSFFAFDPEDVLNKTAFVIIKKADTNARYGFILYGPYATSRL